MKIWKRKPKISPEEQERIDRMKREIQERVKNDPDYEQEVKTKIRKRLNGSLEPGGSHA